MQAERFLVCFYVEIESMERLETFIELLKSSHMTFSHQEVPESKAVVPNTCLTESELRLLRALMEHDTIAEAAEALFISRNTARTHLQHIYEKLGVHSLHRALMEALKRGLLYP